VANGSRDPLRRDVYRYRSGAQSRSRFVFPGPFVPPPPGQPVQVRTQGIPTGSGRRDRPGGWN